jgi:diaminopimelate epimerase
MSDEVHDAVAGLPFTKMHGLGNDYVYVDGFEVTVDDPPAMSRAVSDRRRGIGSDGLILLLPAEAGGDVRMRMFNADGSEAEMCGNGIRCLTRLAVERGRTHADPVHIETASGVKVARCRRDADGRIQDVTVDMGEPAIGPAAVGANPAGLRADAGRGGGAADAADGPRHLTPAVAVAGATPAVDPAWWLVSMGNPHAVCFVDDVAAVDLAAAGPAVERHPAFPARINAHVVSVRSPEHLVVRTWERGSGPTDACGTGACAVAVAASLAGLADRAVRVTLPGGDLQIHWRPDGRVDMTGPAVTVYEGRYRPG